MAAIIMSLLKPSQAKTLGATLRDAVAVPCHLARQKLKKEKT